MRDEVSLGTVGRENPLPLLQSYALPPRFVLVLCGVVCLALFATCVRHFAALNKLGAQAAHLEAQNAVATRQLAQAGLALKAALQETRPAECAFAQLSVVSGLGVSPDLLEIDSALGGNGLAAPLSGEDFLSTYNAREHAGEIISRSRALSWVLSETLAYFFDASQLLSATPSIRPVPVAWLSSSFGVRRHPIFGTLLMHKGLDLAGYVGLTVIAPATGKVVFTGVRGGYGRVVVLDHGYGMQTHFAHLSRSLVKVGETIRRGEPIAEMGSSGNSTGPHLHYEVRHRGQPLDPRRFILD